MIPSPHRLGSNGLEKQYVCKVLFYECIHCGENRDCRFVAACSLPPGPKNGTLLCGDADLIFDFTGYNGDELRMNF
jgi:hypothetical protein